MSQFEGAEEIGGIVGVFGADTKSFDDGVKKVQSGLESLKGKFEAIESAGKKVFLAIGGAAAFSLKAFSDSEQAAVKLRSALETSLGSFKADQLDDTVDRLQQFSEELQHVTSYSKDAIQEQMAFASNLGVTSDALEGVTKIGVGLSARLFGGDLKAGMEAAAQAYSGNFRALQRLIPQLKYATDAQQKWGIVAQFGADGMKQAEEQSETFSGATHKLWNEINTAAESIGALLAPQVEKLTRFLTAAAEAIQHLTPAQKEQVVHWGEVAAAIAGVIAFGPKLISFASNVLGAMTALTRGAGQLMLWLVTSPVGLLVTGIGAVATAFAYAIGSGDTFTQRIGNGFKKIIDFLDPMLGSWAGFVQGLDTLGDQAWDYLLEGFYAAKTALLNGWEAMAGGLEQLWWFAFEKMYDGWQYMQTGAQKFINWFKNTWENLINYLADKFAGFMIRHQAESDIREQYKGKGLSEDQMQQKINDEIKLRMDYTNKNAAARDADKSSAYNKTQSGLDDDYNRSKTYMHDQVETERAAAAQKRRDEIKKNDDADKQIQQSIEQQRRKQLEDDLAKLKGMPKLSDKIKDAYAMLQKGMGLDDIQKFIKGIQDEADKTKNASLKGVNNATIPGMNPMAVAHEGSQAGKSLEDFAKEQLRKIYIGGAMFNQHQEEARKAAAEKAKEKAAAEHTKALQKNAKSTNDLDKTMKDLTNALANGIPALFA